MKWSEMTLVQKIICVIGWICAFMYFILMAIDLFGLLPIHKGIAFPLSAVYWVNMGILLRNNKLAKWCYILAAAKILLALLYIFF